MRDYHLFAHMDRNLVKKGDKVFKYETVIGTLGDGNGQYYAHLHFSISNGLPVKRPAFSREDDLYHYVNGWSEAKVKRYYKNPKDIDFEKMFGRPMNVGGFGYDYLQRTNYNAAHPGVDVNGLGGGNSDFGYNFKSSCTGTVIYEWRGWTKHGGWGNLIVIEEDEKSDTISGKYYMKSQLRNEARNRSWMGGDFDHTDPDDHKALAKKMEEIRKKYKF